jgi:hypothetical protein
MNAGEFVVKVFVSSESYRVRIQKRDCNNGLPYFLRNYRERMDAS